MPEQIAEARLFQLMYRCDEKGLENGESCMGFMQFTNQVSQPSPIVPPQFIHVCTKCRKIKNLDARYPHMISWSRKEPVPDQWLKLLDVSSLESETERAEVLRRIETMPTEQKKPAEPSRIIRLNG